MTLKERTMTMLRIFLHSLVKIDIYIYKYIIPLPNLACDGKDNSYNPIH